MTINIIQVGKIKEKYIKDGIDAYIKKLQRFCKINNIIIDECSFLVDDIKIIKEQTKRITNSIKENSLVYFCDVSSSLISTFEFKEIIEKKLNNNHKELYFIVGGSNGFYKEYLKSIDYKFISFSKMTFIHEMAILILYEQIYRSFKIINNHTYHK